MNKIALTVFIISQLISISSFASHASFTVTVPKTAYLQWLQNPGQPMTRVSNPGKSLRFSGHRSKQAHYLGVMCNSIDGYRIHLSATDFVNSNTARAVSNRGEYLEYRATLKPVQGTLHSGSHSSISLDMTGGNSSINVRFSSGQALPLKPHTRNVFRLTTVAKPEELRRGGHYTGHIMAIIYLP